MEEEESFRQKKENPRIGIYPYAWGKELLLFSSLFDSVLDLIEKEAKDSTQKGF